MKLKEWFRKFMEAVYPKTSRLKNQKESCIINLRVYRKLVLYCVVVALPSLPVTIAVVAGGTPLLYSIVLALIV